MLKSNGKGVREPIYLTKLKSKAKLNDKILQGQQKHQHKRIEYDLHLYHQSLSSQKMKNNSQRRIGEKLMNSQELFASHRVQSEGLQVMSNRDTKFKLNQTIKYPLSQSYAENNFFSHSPFTPYEHVNYQRIQKKCEPTKENMILYQPQLINLKARTVQTIRSSKNDVLMQISISTPNAFSNQFKQSQESLDEIHQKKQSYPEADPHTQRINELQHENQEAQCKIAILQQRLKASKQVQLRVQKIQKDIQLIYQESHQLQQINQNISHSSILLQASVQTGFIPVYVQDAFCQTSAPPQNPLRNPQGRLSEDLSYRNWRMEYQRQRMIGMNRQKQHRITIQNMQIESRQAMGLLQRQLETITMKYDVKCQEIREKQAIITKYIVNK